MQPRTRSPRLEGVTPAEELAFTQFVRDRGDDLQRYARWLIPDAAESEDALQVALLRLARRWSSEIRSPEAYVRVTLRNVTTDRARRRHLVPVPTLDAGRAPRDSPDHADALAAQTDLDEILATLPPRQRVTVVMRVLEGLTEAETAAALDCSPGTVKSNLARGLQRAREAHAARNVSQEGTSR